MNTDIRRLARGKDVPLWRIAQELGISEPTMTRRLRKELPNEERIKIINIIEQLSVEVQL